MWTARFRAGASFRALAATWHDITWHHVDVTARTGHREPHNPGGNKKWIRSLPATVCWKRPRCVSSADLVYDGRGLDYDLEINTHSNYHDEDMVRKAAELADRLGMEVYSFHAPFAPFIDITDPDDGRRRRARDEIMEAAGAAALLGARHFVIHPGPEEARQSPDEVRLRHLKNAAGVLDRVSERCRELGGGFVLENMLSHLVFGNSPDILWIMGAIENVNVGTCLDHGPRSADRRHLPRHVQVVRSPADGPRQRQPRRAG